MNTARRLLTTATAGLGGMIMLSLAANANAQCRIQTNRTFVQGGAVVAVPVAPVVVAAQTVYARGGHYPPTYAAGVAYPAAYAPVGTYPVAYPQVITPAPVAVYAPPQVVYTRPVIVAPAPVYRTYGGHTRIITYSGHGHGRRHVYKSYRGHRSGRHGGRGVRVNFGLRIGH